MLEEYLRYGLRHPVPRYANPADHALEVVNTEFIPDPGHREAAARQFAMRWAIYEQAFRSRYPTGIITQKSRGRELPSARTHRSVWKRVVRRFQQTWILANRNSLNYSRNMLAYGVRIAMYCEYLCSCLLSIIKARTLMRIFCRDDGCYLVPNIVGMGILLATVWMNLSKTSAKIVRISLLYF